MSVEITGPMKARNAKGTCTDVTTAQFEEAMVNYAGAEGREEEINKHIKKDVNEVLIKYEDELMCLSVTKGTAFEIAQSYS